MAVTCAFGSTGANLALAATFSAGGYLALHLSDPDTLEPGPTEVADPAYVRQAVKFTLGARVASQNNSIVFTGLSATTIPYIGIWNQVSSGGLLGLLDLTASPLVVPSNGLVRCPPNTFAFGL